ncbi:oxidoreductase [Glaciihabitans sp. dw_435]|uniref:oxidoreductase n=1 Tax=Glaciihabitans sp. dw_435 TaxID=2720081 RepID=UPI001BD1DF73|nr:oxidoreductase [Glaciihabitans sp. dw_435]
MTDWTAADIPDQRGRVIVVTGASSGLGQIAARELAAHGATVILACRDIRKGQDVAAAMTGDVSVRLLDLADLASIRAFADGTGDIDVLINNAGVMATPQATTVDGFELQLGTNFLGPFALTGLLLPRIRQRVVALGSVAHRAGHIDLDDLNWRRRRYRPWGAYGQSKLADVMFAYELDRRLVAAGSPVLSVAAHPGYSFTQLHTHMASGTNPVVTAAIRLTAQSSEVGALSVLYAATAPDVVGGAYYGPGGLGGLRGHPRRVASTSASRDDKVASRLWDSASELTGVVFPLPPR